VAYGRGADLVSHIDNELRDQRPGKGGREVVLALIASARFEGRPDVLGDELLLGVDDARLGQRADGQRLLQDGVIVALFTHIDADGDDIEPSLFLDPPHRDRGIQSTGIR